MISRHGSRYVLRSHEGRILGRHPSRAAAERQERAIQLSKARAAGRTIPRARHNPGPSPTPCELGIGVAVIAGIVLLGFASRA